MITRRSPGSAPVPTDTAAAGPRAESGSVHGYDVAAAAIAQMHAIVAYGAVAAGRTFRPRAVMGWAHIHHPTRVPLIFNKTITMSVTFGALA